MRPFWLQMIDTLLGTLVLRAVFGWLAANPRVLKLLIPIGVAALLLLLNAYLQLPLATMLVLFVAMPIAVVLLISALGEMRSFYEPAALREMFSFGRGNVRGFAQEFAATLRELSRERTGALIVVPRQDDCHRLLTGGERYDAQFARSLLLAIFNTKSPRHDGALVLEGERVIWVGAVLPLASAEGVREEWGTRHLAAVGLSENCDADILVVSEERGTISHARHGRLTPLAADSDAALAAALENALGWSNHSGKRPWRGISKSILLWAAALGVSILASFNVDNLASRFFSKPALITSREVAINLINVPPGLFVDGLSAGKCEILVQVPKDWFVIGNIQWPVVVDLTGYGPGPETIPLTRSLIPKFPREWVIYRFTPDQIRFNLVAVRHLNLAVTPRLKGLRNGLKIVQATVEPANLEVEIRDAKWRDGRTLETYEIDLSQIEEPGEYAFDSWMNLPATITPKQPSSDDYKVKVTVRIGAA